MKSVKIKELENKDLNEFRDELFPYLVMLFNAQSKSTAKLLDIFLEELDKLLKARIESVMVNIAPKTKKRRGNK